MALGVNSVVKSFVQKNLPATAKQFANIIKIAGAGIVGLGIIFTFGNYPTPGHQASDTAVALLSKELSAGGASGTGVQVITGITTDGSIYTKSGSIILGDLANPTCTINHDGTTTGCTFGTMKFSTGSLMGAFDKRYVSKQGDTMTGALVINVTGGNPNTRGLNVLNTASGAIVHGEKSLTTSGTLVFEGAASGSSLYLGTSLNGAGLSACNSANNALEWNNATGRFSCVTIAGASYTAGQGLTLTSSSFKTNSTMTGSLSRYTTESGENLFAHTRLTSSGALKVLGNMSGASLNVNALKSCANVKTDANGLTSCNATTYITGAAQGLSIVNSTSLKLNATITGSLVSAQTVSGSAVYAKNTLTSSGSLKVLGNMSGASLNVNALKSCTNLQTNASGLLSCNATAYQTTTLTQDSALVGNTSNIATANALPSCSGGGNGLQYNTATHVFACGTFATATYTAGRGLGLSSGIFTLNATITGSLVNFGTHSGYTLYAKTTLASSGSLKVLGNMSGATLNVNALKSCVNIQTDANGRLACNASTYQTTALTTDNTWVGQSGTATATALPSCSNGSTNALEYNTSTHAFSCVTIAGGATVTAGQGLTSTSNAFSVNATQTGTMLRYLTVSGSTLFAKSRLTSSGSFKVLGDMSGATVHVNNMASFSGALSVQSTGRFKSGLNVVGTSSGNILAAQKNLTSSGTLEVTNGALFKGTISGALLVISGTTKFSTHTYTWPSTQGTNGQALTNNGSDTLSWVTPSATVTPVMQLTGDFSSGTARNSSFTGGAGAVAWPNGSDPLLQIDTSATITSYADVETSMQNLNETFKTFSGSPTFSTAVEITTIGTTADSFFGIENASIKSGTAFDYTGNHIGFKIIISGSTASLYATQADGTETASSALTTFAANDEVDLIFKVNGSSSVDYYWRKNGGALSAATNLATHIPALSTGSPLLEFAIGNHGTATQSTFQVVSYSYQR